uniref:Uncharacterized protein n=1 Tax=Megaselia scalaris TaxID=36166 RepID=T1GJJ3_MEGSC
MSENKLPELPANEYFFPPYIAPPCNLPCCRPQSLPRNLYPAQYPRVPQIVLRNNQQPVYAMQQQQSYPRPYPQYQTIPIPLMKS